MSDTKRESWGSRIGFIFAAAGFAIGLGNIWRFPYLVGTYGGGAFVLVYVIICALIGWPLLTAEFALGRRTKLTPILAMRKLEGGKPTLWSLIGWVGCIACVILLSYYLVIIGWMVRYSVLAVCGKFTGVQPADTKAIFNAFMANPLELAFYTLIVIAVLGITIARGLKKGVEAVCTWLLPILAVLIVILAIRSLTMTPQVEGGRTALDAIKWYLTPDFSKLSGKAILAALGQSFFSIGVGIATAIVYGSYLHDDSDIPQDSIMIITLDTGFALLAGVVIFPALFCYGMDVGSGPSLLMETMPVIFGQMAGGTLWGALFFFLVAVAGFTSAIGYLEAPVASFAEYFHVDRKKMTWIVLAIIFVLSIPSILSQSVWGGVKLHGKIIFDFADWLSGDIMMPVDALLISLYVAFVWKFREYQLEANQGAKTFARVPSILQPWMYVLPFVLAFILYRGI